ncbi:uncharacterized protein PITG_08106 [Phytophthora infestans T30-4]|uniref:Uncharacterized protein n=1 Tax=Phytophthora infestans (strain T30-4) TaxID=403677 RepID=D0N9H3_PHYIT|nr:uncharacterized protein PITG_08106 [Phytophthora infestans T30-4]EEY54461.1 conserved hypothetical protein [Phytophthora infestans T30-4]|eukprot:XP_002904283.1 conserved hypothetical protein [Phytophthora infestans T30-4]
MSRTATGVYIKRLEDLLYDTMHEVIYFPACSAAEEWEDLVNRFVSQGSDYPDVACASDGTIIQTRLPRDHMSIWNQSEVLGPRARYICPARINWLADSEFKMWSFLMVPFDERCGRRVSR